MTNDHEGLLDILRSASSRLEGVTEKVMFGCPALFANGTIFAMVWKEGRIAVKLKDAELHAKLMAHPGAESWSPGRMTMKSWVLVAPKLETPKALAPWLEKAHALARVEKTAPAKTAAAKKKTAAKKR